LALHNLTASSAKTARFGKTSGSGTGSGAIIAGNILPNGDFFTAAKNRFFKINFELTTEVGSTANTTSSSTDPAHAKEVSENIAEGGENILDSDPRKSTETGVSQPIKTVPVVKTPFLLVRKDFIGLRGLFELGFCVVTVVPIGVILHSQSAIRLFDCSLFGVSLDTQYFVIIALGHNSSIITEA
jgi:hypothetical protein